MSKPSIGVRKNAIGFWFAEGDEGLSRLEREADGVSMPGIRDGSASDKLIVLAPQLTKATPLLEMAVPFRCTPLMAPFAAKSTVPVGDGKSVKLPARLMFSRLR